MIPSVLFNEFCYLYSLQVYTTGLVLFNELEKYLKKIESRFSGWNLVLNGFSNGFADIVDMLKLERSEFEVSFFFPCM